jgi:FMN-dependent oxidoreductase (nitrilotriacetate monooxygenase family)
MMNLVGFVYPPVAHNAGGWRNSRGRTDFLDAGFYRSVARTLEDGFFDMAFLPDGQGIYEEAGDFSTVARYGGQGAMSLEPMVTLATMMTATQHLGLAATMSTTLYPPYHIARIMASLDHLSGGRMAWNIVTSFGTFEARNFGLPDLPPRSERYAIAEDTLKACLELWNSWEPDALVLDRETPLFADPGKISYVDYQGTYVSTRGPLNVPRSPQGRPLLMQAGASEAGREFCATWAEAVFTLQTDIDSMRAFRNDIRKRAVQHGRDPDSIKVLPAIQPVVGETTVIAKMRRDHLASLVTLDVALATVSAHTGLDLRNQPLDQPLKDLAVETGARGSFDQLLRGTDARDLTLAEVALEFCTTELNPQLVGTGAEIADQMQEMFEAQACDGFVVTPTSLPDAFEDFARTVSPELQKRGLLRTEYPAGTLRDTFGLPPVQR